MITPFKHVARGTGECPLPILDLKSSKCAQFITNLTNFAAIDLIISVYYYLKPRFISEVYTIMYSTSNNVDHLIKITVISC